MGHGDSAASKDAWGCAEVMGSNIFNSQTRNKQIVYIPINCQCVCSLR